MGLLGVNLYDEVIICSIGDTNGAVQYQVVYV
jgi:hypothetical protein